MLKWLKKKISENMVKTAILSMFIAVGFVFVLFLQDARHFETNQENEKLLQTLTNEQVMEKLQLSGEVDLLRQRLDEVESEKAQLLDSQMEVLDNFTLDYAGTYYATAYCAEEYPHICGGNGITASGTKPTPGITCAADWNVFPPGTWLYIDGVGIRRVEDSGSAIKGKRLDIIVDTHDNALRWAGLGNHEVWVLNWEEE